MNYPSSIKDIYQTILKEEDLGAIATYIPELAKVNPNKFGVHLITKEGFEFGIGDYKDQFSIQSISKVLLLSLAYQLLGDSIWSRVGVEPSGTAFNSLIQLESDLGIPRNPFINAGAMVICDLLISQLVHPKEDFLEFVQNITGNTDIIYSKKVAQSEQKVGYRNVALCYFIKSFDNIKNDPEEVLDFYFHVCSIEMSCQELSNSFHFLANDGFRNIHQEEVISMSKAKRINAIMQTCGFYDESGEFSFKVGLPGKSGVGGGIIALHPDKYSIAVWSPKLNDKGNSYRGMRFLELWTSKIESSIF